MSVARSITRRAPAKVNLFLRVLARRPDGYHDIRSVLTPLELADSLEFSSTSDWSLATSDPDLPADERNLVTRAARLLAEAAGRTPGAAVFLKKRIPSEAGLGGGSSDAAATLLGLSTLWETRLADGEIRWLAVELGADVPFFLGGEPALAEGIGERVTGLGPLPPLDVVLCVRRPGVATAWAYERCHPLDEGPSPAELLSRWRAGDVIGVAESLWNDLEAAVLPRRPDIAAAKEALLTAGALGAVMTGSGSAVFGLARDAEHARAIAATLTSAHGEVIVTRTATTGAAA